MAERDPRKWREAEEFWKRMPRGYEVFHLADSYTPEQIAEMIRRGDPRAKKFVEAYEELKKLLEEEGG